MSKQFVYNFFLGTMILCMGIKEAGYATMSDDEDLSSRVIIAGKKPEGPPSYSQELAPTPSVIATAKALKGLPIHYDSERNLYYFIEKSASTNRCLYCRDLREDCLESKSNGHGSTGKWLDNVTPKRGWKCFMAEDLGIGKYIRCQMCEVEQIRYVHHMQHGDHQHPLLLKVGCICCGHMEGRDDNQAVIFQSITAAQRRTSDLQNRAARRENFPNLKNPIWRISKKGNPYINYEGKNIVVFKKNNDGTSELVGYSAVIKNLETDESEFIYGVYPSIDEAKLAAFDYLSPPFIYVQ